MNPKEATNSEKRGRLLEAAMALLQGAPNGELKVVLLNKGLFYLDLLCLRDYGRTATGATYLALHQGPVVAKYDKHLVRALEDEGLAEQLQAGMAKPIRLKKPLSAFEYLDDDAVKLAGELGKEIATITSSGASEFSHENPAWRLAYDSGLGAGGGPKPINMRIALQQLNDADSDDHDPWLDEDPDEPLLKAFRDASAGNG
jgi:hypothetical protein